MVHFPKLRFYFFLKMGQGTRLRTLVYGIIGSLSLIGTQVYIISFFSAETKNLFRLAFIAEVFLLYSWIFYWVFGYLWNRLFVDTLWRNNISTFIFYVFAILAYSAFPSSKLTGRMLHSKLHIVTGHSKSLFY